MVDLSYDSLFRFQVFRMFTKQPLERDLGGLDSYLFRLMLHHVSATREFDNKGLEPYPVTFPSGFLRVFCFTDFHTCL